jgi:primosomal protein N' (replication factor Y)
MYDMHYYEVAPTQIVRPGSSVFTYAHADVLEIGLIVLIEVGRKQITGIVLKKVDQPKYETKMIVSIIEPIPLPSPLLELAKWMSTYYVTHLGVVLQTLLPRGIQKTRRERPINPSVGLRSRTKIVFNKDQQSSLEQIEKITSGTVLLHGITGSGKTAVYIDVAKHMLDSGKSVVILVPEIALTSQIVDEFAMHFEDIILTHSRQTEAERHLAWRDALTSKKPRVVIGPRSALFMPLADIGLIVIDEMHEPSFKQEQSPRYSALRAASILAKEHQAKLILGSATPSISDYFIAKESKRPIFEMLSTAKISKPPVVTLVDMTKRHHFKRHRFLSDILLTQLEETFANGKQTLIFHNRRGSASTTLCENCGWQATCPKCFTPLTLHADNHELRCHICAHNEKVPTSCPICQHPSIIHKGIGTKLVESELAKLFPHATIGRFDGDSDAGQTVDIRYKELYEGSINLIVGTQVIAKGLDLPNLRTVGVIQADSGLSLPDFSATERTFQLLAQVVGRVGRSDHSTSVIVQSYQPKHPAVVDGLSQNYSAFYEKAIVERRRANFPPFTHLLKLTCIYKTEATAIRNAQNLAQILRKKFSTDIEVLGPTPAFYERQRDTYRWQLVLKSKKRSLLVEALQSLPPTHWQSELDPISLL